MFVNIIKKTEMQKLANKLNQLQTKFTQMSETSGELVKIAGRMKTRK
jgi:X-X-X-Leu-X-X-Gly heptad repeat protein